MASYTKTAYQILGVSEEAQYEDIKSAYKKMALRSHPDKNPNDPQAKSTFQLVSQSSSSLIHSACINFLANQISQISEAYETLGDAHRRYIYDAKLRSQRGVPMFFGGPRTQQNASDGGSEIPSWLHHDDQPMPMTGPPAFSNIGRMVTIDHRPPTPTLMEWQCPAEWRSKWALRPRTMAGIHTTIP